MGADQPDATHTSTQNLQLGFFDPVPSVMTIEMIEGDCRDVLRELESQSVNCIVTSPPYFGLRDYGVEGQMGLEPTPDEFVGALVGVLREARQVLRDDGTLWLNLGDSYAGSWGNASGENRGKGIQRSRVSGSLQNDLSARNGTFVPPGKYGFADLGIKKKDLIGIPWRVAFALQADGWYLRQDIIWHKPNPMPESVTDRCTKAHEYIFMLSKSERYYFDAEAIREPAVAKKGNAKSFRGGGSYTGGNSFDNSAVKDRETHGNVENETGMRNRRSVWTVSTKPFKDAHFATFPPDLIEPCVLAGCPAGGVVLDPFFGAGTTGLVCQKAGRDCIGIELSPTYFDIAAKRLGLLDEAPVMQAAE